MIRTLIQVAAVIFAVYFTWRLNQRISTIDNRFARFCVRIFANVVAAAVILMLLVFLLFRANEGGD